MSHILTMQPAPIHTQYVRRVVLLDPLPEGKPLTEAQLAQRQAARDRQAGPKSANRVKR